MRKQHTSSLANFTTYWWFRFPRVVIISTLLVPEVKLVLTAPHYTGTRIITPPAVLICQYTQSQSILIREKMFMKSRVERSDGDIYSLY